MIIFDNDEGFLLPDTAVSVNENVGTLQFAIARSGASNRAASVDYSTANGTAVAGSDYSAVSGTLTWAAGDSEFKTIEIPITDDQDDENDESFTVSLSNPTGGVPLAANSTASVTIVDDDTAGGGGGGGGATGLELLALLGLLNAFAMRKRRWLANATQSQIEPPTRGFSVLLHLEADLDPQAGDQQRSRPTCSRANARRGGTARPSRLHHYFDRRAFVHSSIALRNAVQVDDTIEDEAGFDPALQNVRK